MAISAQRTALKPGYKQTEVGVIPEDWEVRLLRDVVDFANGKPHEGDVDPDGRYYLITLDSIGIDGRLKPEHKRTNVLDSSLKKNDIVSVLSDLAHGSLLGLCDLIPTDDTYVLNQRMGRLRLKVSASPQFVRLQINRRQEHFRQRGQGTSQRHVYRRDFDSLLIPFPAPVEQEAIAAALSDVDALVASLDRLIAKKRDIKQAAMQQLLTSKTRLPGFGGEWEVRKLDEITEVVMGQSPLGTSYNRDGNGYPLINGPTEFTDRYPIKIQWTDQPTKFCKKDDILLCVRGSSTGRINIANDDYCIGRGIAAIRAKAGTDARYVTFQVEQAVINILALTTGSTFPNIDGKSLRAIMFLLPSLPEQYAISALLSDMDAEIAALEQKRDKTRAVKQGLMQELLTGRIRLV